MGGKVSSLSTALLAAQHQAQHASGAVSQAQADAQRHAVELRAAQEAARTVKVGMVCVLCLLLYCAHQQLQCCGLQNQLARSSVEAEAAVAAAKRIADDACHSRDEALAASTTVRVTTAL